MRKLTPVLLFLSLVVSGRAQQFVNGQAARATLGQVNFTQGDSASSNVILGAAGGVAFDPISRRLYVADSNRVGASADGNADTQNSRVVVFDTTQILGPRDPLQNNTFSLCYVCGYSAWLSLGQSQWSPYDNGFFDAGLAATNTSQPYLYNAVGVATDGKILAVADTDNNRVLIWTTVPTAQNQLPNLVLGQPDLSTRQSPGQGVVNSTIMRGPEGVWIQGTHLFVADTENNRILVWNSIPTVNNQPPDLELGQPDFNHANAPPVTVSGNPNAAANQLLNPTSVTSDGKHVFVTDLGFNRVLIWNNFPTSNGQNADVEIGQPDMVQTIPNDPNSCGPLAIGIYGACQANLSYPRFALPDSNGRLFVADAGNDRVLIYNAIPTTNGVSADGVLGQPDFVNDIVSSVNIPSTDVVISTAVDNTGAVDITPSPTSLAWDGTNLYVADPFNRRVEVFTAGDAPLYSNQYSTPPLFSILNWASRQVRQEGLVTFSVVGGIVAADTATITIQSVDYTYTIKAADTVDTIAQALVALINKAPDANATATFAGINSGTVYLSSKNVNVSYDSISLSTTTSNTANLASVASNGYLTAGNAATGAPGMLIEVDAPPGTTFTDSDAVLTPSFNGQALPTTLGGVQLSLDGFASPLLKVSKTQIVGQIPFYYIDRNSTSVYVRTQHDDGHVTVTNAAPIYIAPANPGIFDAPGYPDQQPPLPASQAYHQPTNPTAVISVDGSVTANDTATITIAGIDYKYTVVAADTLLTIAQNLVNLINATDQNVSAALGGSFDRIVLTARQPGAAGNGITIAVTENTGATEVLTDYSNGQTCCNVTGGSVITPTNPAGPGELITVNAAGLGVVSDVNGNGLSVQTGFPYAGPAVNSAASFVAATMGGVTSQVVTAGLTPGAYGIYGVQMVVPTSLTPSSTTQLYIAQNAFVSNTVTLAVGTPVPGAPAVGPTATPSPITTTIDSPSANATVSGVIAAYGWALDTSAPITGVAILVDGISFGTGTYGASRPDVCAAYPGSISCPNVGWTGSLDTTSLPNGAHSFQVTVTDANGTRFTSSTPFVVSNDNTNNPTHLNIDVPGPGYTYHGALTLFGWALNDTAPMSSVQVFVDGALRGNATYGTGRVDVCSTYPGRPGCPNVGWSYFLDTATLADGTHSFSITGTAANGQKSTIGNSFIVANHVAANPVLITIDTPGSSSGSFSGIATFAGWALDANSIVNSITVAVDGVVYGPANYNLTRTDVCTAYPNYAGCPNVGWNAAIDTTQLSDGQHTLAVTANPGSGQSFTTTTTFSVANLATAANPVRITVDNPGYNGTVSGITGIRGWAISDNSAIATVQVRVDGLLQGNAVYGESRPDVCAVYPGRPGCPTVGWNYALNTTKFSDGTHMVEITATTASGERATTSQPLIIANGAASNTGPGRIQIESPSGESNPFNGIAQFFGWAINDNAAVSSISVSVDGVPYGTATYGYPRPDVCTVFPGRPGCPNVGWSFTLDTTRFADGVHTLSITEVLADGTFFTASNPFTVGNWSGASPMQIQIDSPSTAAPLVFGNITLAGWVINGSATITNVALAIDGVPLPTSNSVYGAPRPDVCLVYGSPNCPNVGFSYQFDTTLIPDGQHTLAVTGTTSLGQSATSTVGFAVVN